MWRKTESWDSSSWRFLRILSKHAKNQKGKCKEDRASLFSGVPSDNGHKLKHRKLPLNIKKHFSTLRITEHWHRLPKARWLNQIPAILWRTAKKEQHPSLRLYILPSLCCYSQWLGYTQVYLQLQSHLWSLSTHPKQLMFHAEDWWLSLNYPPLSCKLFLDSPLLPSKNCTPEQLLNDCSWQ